MSYGIVRVQKMTSGAVKGIEIHDRREKENSNTNPDINFNLSFANYDLCPSQNENFYQAVKERIDSLNLPRAVRKDAIVMGQVLVTSDMDFFMEMDMQYGNMRAALSSELYNSDVPFSASYTDPYINSRLGEHPTKEFFRRAYDFLADRYGRENVISAVVHMDEKGAPHMHFNFVPVTEDGRLCAKEVFSRNKLIEQQDAFYEQVGKDYGLLRGEPKEKGKRRKHLETAEYKEAMQMVSEATEKLSEARESVSKVEARIETLQQQESALKREIEGLQSQREAVKQEVPALVEQIHELRNEITVSERALDSLQSEGERKVGKAGWEAAIQKTRAEMFREKLARFAEHIINTVPGIRNLWERFERADKTRGKEQEWSI